MDYDKPGPGDYYQLAKRTGKETLIEPYKYTVAGKEVMITTTSVPIVINGQFMGVAGIDLPLSSLQEKVQAIRIYDTGYASLLSHGALYVGDRDPAHVGQALTKPAEHPIKAPPGNASFGTDCKPPSVIARAPYATRLPPSMCWRISGCSLCCWKTSNGERYGFL